MPDIHLPYGGSTIDRTLNCPAWHNISADVPKIDRSSSAAERGTGLHEVMESTYNELGALEDLVAKLPQGDADACRVAYAAAEALFDKYGIEQILVEPFVTLREDIGGSADLIACSDEVAIILDWKFGHVPVKSHNQFKLYAIAALNTAGVDEMLKGKRLISAIIQPEVSHDAIVIEHTDKDLARFEKDVLLARKNAITAMDGFPGAWCRYCPGATVCLAKRSQVVTFMDANPKATEGLNEAAGLLDAMKEQIKAVESEMMYALEAGRPVAGF